MQKPGEDATVRPRILTRSEERKEDQAEAGLDDEQETTGPVDRGHFKPAICGHMAPALTLMTFIKAMGRLTDDL